MQFLVARPCCLQYVSVTCFIFSYFGDCFIFSYHWECLTFKITFSMLMHSLITKIRSSKLLPCLCWRHGKIKLRNFHLFDGPRRLAPNLNPFADLEKAFCLYLMRYRYDKDFDLFAFHRGTGEVNPYTAVNTRTVHGAIIKLVMDLRVEL